MADNAPIVPISAQLKYNIEAVNEYIVKKIPIPVRDFTADPRLIVIRSFDVNKPGAEVDDLREALPVAPFLPVFWSLAMKLKSDRAL